MPATGNVPVGWGYVPQRKVDLPATGNVPVGWGCLSDMFHKEKCLPLEMSLWDGGCLSDMFHKEKYLPLGMSLWDGGRVFKYRYLVYSGRTIHFN